MRVLKSVRQHIENYHLKAGIFHFYRGEHGPAEEFFNRALEDADLSAPDRRSAVYFLVQTHIGAARRYIESGELDLAIAEYQRALSVMPSYPDVHAKLARTLAETGRIAEAVTHFQAAVDINPHFVDAWLGLGHALLALGNAADAKEAFRAAVRAREAVTLTKLESAELAVSRGRTEEAADIYRDAFGARLSEFRSHFERGMNFLRHEKWDDAANALRIATSLCPRFADAHNYLGVALAEGGELEQACESFQRSVAINPDYIVAWLNLAYVRHEWGDRNGARAALLEVLRREPDNAPARHLDQTLREPCDVEGQRTPLGTDRPVTGSSS